MKHLAQISLLTGVLFALASQGALAAPSSMGVQGGINIGSAMVDPSDSTTMQSGVMAGAFFELGITDMFFFQPEVMYVRKAATAVNKSKTTTYRIDYVSIPLLAKAKFKPMAGIIPFVFLGPNVGVKVGANYDVAVGSSSSQGSLVGIKSTDINIDFGVGGDFNITTGIAAVLSARYSLGMMDIDTSPTTWNPRGIQFLAGVKLSL